MIQAWFSARMCELKLEEEEQADPEIPTTIPEIQHNSNSEILHIDNNSTSQVAEPFNLHLKLTDLEATYFEDLNRVINGNEPTSISNGFVAMSNVVDASLQSTEEGVNRPPLKPPHLYSHAEVLDGVEDNAGLNCSGGCLSDVVDDGSRSSAEVSASVRKKWTLSSAMVSLWSEDELLAVLYWDKWREGTAEHVGSIASESELARSDGSTVDGVGVSMLGLCFRAVQKMMRLHSLYCLSNENEGRVLLPLQQLGRTLTLKVLLQWKVRVQIHQWIRFQIILVI
ncbi:hypothetical protein PIB30_014651 [Stylosanthes scabra]|uniref:Uncharacterized protein n=1 Tax=Stylosanthes scabra TaxID=79078 RepID=A0ABU6S6Z0_9FABA|nr:hypothetical protein [Stylosanthes scabra]